MENFKIPQDPWKIRLDRSYRQHSIYGCYDFPIKVDCLIVLVNTHCLNHIGNIPFKGVLIWYVQVYCPILLGNFYGTNQFNNISVYRKSYWPNHFDCNTYLEQYDWPDQLWCPIFSGDMNVPFYLIAILPSMDLIGLFIFKAPIYSSDLVGLLNSIFPLSSRNPIEKIKFTFQPSLSVLVGLLIWTYFPELGAIYWTSPKLWRQVQFKKIWIFPK